MIYLSLLLATMFLVHNTEAGRYVSTIPGIAFAGGFGCEKKAKWKTMALGKNKSRKKRDALAEINPFVDPSTTSDGSKQQELDKWGLPVPSADDLFALLDSEVELISVDPGVQPSLSDIQHCTESYTDLRLGQIFDSKGVEKYVEEAGREPMKLQLLHKSPPVLSIDNFFSRSECEEIESARKFAHEIESATFAGAISTRTSTSWFCRFIDVPALLAKANQVLNFPLENMEEPQIVRYERGQEFSWHYDEVPPSQSKNGGQRLATLLVYLNDVEEHCGGGTEFRDLRIGKKSLVVQPKKGSALLFFPAFRDGVPDDRTLHRSLPLTCEREKWIVQVWVHQEKYNAVLPAGNSNIAARGKMIEAIKSLGYSTNLEEM